MKIIFTGVSSFTGYWFAKELVKNGHEVFVTFRKNHIDEYEGIRRFRVEGAIQVCKPVFNCEFGGDNFLKVIEDENFDLLCHHAAEVTDYKSPDFDISSAVASNTKNIKEIIKKLSSMECKSIIVTGTYFEQNEGIGSENRAFSPYGLSKSLSFEIIKYYTSENKLKLGKFVLPNPFGPYEEQRFTSYLAKTWLQNKIAEINNPLYVRDNIHVSLLAKAYSSFIKQIILSNDLIIKFNPSGYIGSQGEFAERFANEMRKRIRLPCKIKVNKQIEFREPMVRINTEYLTHDEYRWNETVAWDELIEYYKKEYY